jgi:hypothetical protein
MTAQTSQPAEQLCTSRSSPTAVYPRGCDCSSCDARRRAWRAADEARRGSSRLERRATLERRRELSERAWAEIDWMLRRRWTSYAMASTMQVEESTVRKLIMDLKQNGHRKLLRVSTAEMVLAHGPHPAEGSMTVVGAMRRLRALAHAAWPLPAIAERAGLSVTEIHYVMAGARPTLRVWVHDIIAATFDQLTLRAGSDLEAATRARSRGWAPAGAWLGLDMDDPDVRPVTHPQCDDPPPSQDLLRKRQTQREYEARRRALRKAAGGGALEVVAADGGL